MITNHAALTSQIARQRHADLLREARGARLAREALRRLRTAPGDSTHRVRLRGRAVRIAAAT